MFVTKKVFERVLAEHRRELARLEERYWELCSEKNALSAAHYRLVRHLGLIEETRPSETVLRAKGGPERATED